MKGKNKFLIDYSGQRLQGKAAAVTAFYACFKG
jgi:hypothetical protein